MKKISLMLLVSLFMSTAFADCTLSAIMFKVRGGYASMTKMEGVEYALLDKGWMLSFADGVIADYDNNDYMLSAVINRGNTVTLEIRNILFNRVISSATSSGHNVYNAFERAAEKLDMCPEIM